MTMAVGLFVDNTLSSYYLTALTNDKPTLKFVMWTYQATYTPSPAAPWQHI